MWDTEPIMQILLHTAQCYSDENLMLTPHLLRGTLNQYSGFIFFFPYDIIGVDFGIFLSIGLPMRSLKYRGGSSHDLAGLGISSVNILNQHCFTALIQDN